MTEFTPRDGILLKDTIYLVWKRGSGDDRVYTAPEGATVTIFGENPVESDERYGGRHMYWAEFGHFSFGVELGVDFEWLS